MPPTALWSAMSTHPAADVHELVHFLERVIHDHDARRFGRHVAVLSDRHADRRRHHGRGVIDAVADVEGFRLRGFLADDGELFFRTFLGVDFGDAHLLGQIAHLRLAISGDDHDALELVLGSQSAARKNGSPLAARPESARSPRSVAVDHHHAFQSTGQRRKLIRAGNFFAR